MAPVCVCPSLVLYATIYPSTIYNADMFSSAESPRPPLPCSSCIIINPVQQKVCRIFSFLGIPLFPPHAGLLTIASHPLQLLSPGHGLYLTLLSSSCYYVYSLTLTFSTFGFFLCLGLDVREELNGTTSSHFRLLTIWSRAG